LCEIRKNSLINRVGTKTKEKRETKKSQTCEKTIGKKVAKHLKRTEEES
jgi:hypothetical protein